MPTYVYKFVETGETIEVQQLFTDETLTEIAHPESGDVLSVKKVFQPVGVTFKGSGFFKTDNRGSKATTPPGSSDSSSGSDSASSKGSDSGSSNGSSSSDSGSGSSSSEKTSTSKDSGSAKDSSKPKPKPKSASSGSGD